MLRNILYSVVVLVALLATAVLVSVVSASGGHQPITVCHNNSPLVIDFSALQAHLRHGDYVPTGQHPCPASTSVPTTVPTTQPTTVPTVVPTTAPTQEVTPEPTQATEEPTETTPEPTVSPTEPVETEEPTVVPTEPTSVPTDEVTVTAVAPNPQPAQNTSKGPAYIPGPRLTQVCVYGIDLPGSEYEHTIRWQIRGETGEFEDVDPLAVTGIEIRYVTNPLTNYTADHEMSCLVLVDVEVSTDPNNYRALNHATGEVVGEWIVVYTNENN